MDDPRSVRKRERHVDLVRALDDLEGIGHVHGARDARQVALEFGIPVDPVFPVLLLDRERLRRVRNPPLTTNDPHRAGNTGRRPERDERGRRHPGVLIGIRALLGHPGRECLVGLEIPMRLVQCLPDPVEVRPAIRHLGCTRGHLRLRCGGRAGHHDGESGANRCAAQRRERRRPSQTRSHDHSPSSASPPTHVAVSSEKGSGPVPSLNRWPSTRAPTNSAGRP